MKVFTNDQAIREAITRFGDQICEELNVKKVSIVESDSPAFFTIEACIRPVTIKFEFGSKAGQVMAALDKLPREKKGELAKRNEPFTLTLASGESVSLVPLEHFELRAKGKDGWAVVEYLGTYVGIDARITDPLKKEGLAREVVRHVQNARKEAGLEMEDRIVLYLHTESKELHEAIEAHKEYICRETLAVQLVTQPLGEGAYQATVKVDGQPLTIELRKIS
jgi:isoleucyl-tRNA synthetase